MKDKIKVKDKFSAEDVKRANDLLRWYLREILYADTWKAHPYYKVIIGQDIARDLEEFGFKWQAERVRNHLHKWMKSISCKIPPRDLDTLEREREVSF